MTIIQIEVGNFYRNAMGATIAIVGTVLPSNRFYKKGFRFVDQRGTYYDEFGGVHSKMFSQLNLVEHADPESISQSEIFDLATQSQTFQEQVSAYARLNRTYRFVKKYILVASGANIGVGYCLVRLAVPFGYINIVAGILGIVYESRKPDNLAA